MTSRCHSLKRVHFLCDLQWSLYFIYVAVIWHWMSLPPQCLEIWRFSKRCYVFQVSDSCKCIS